MADKHHLTEDEKVLHSMGYAQELARRMGKFSNFAISFSIICILAGGITAFPVAFSAGGGFSVSIGWVIGGLFALVVAASVGQIASAYPTAGGLYHWASILGGRGWGWLCAWINLVGLIFVVASVNFGVYLLFKDLLLTGVLGIDTSHWTAWHASAFVTVFAVTQALFNHFGIKVTTMLTDFSGYLIFVIAILLTLTMLVWGASFDLSRLTTFINNTGEAGGLVVPEPRTALIAFLIGLLYPLYTITGFDASAHTSEETVDARATVPKGMLHSVFWSLLFGFFLASSFVLAMPDTTAAAKEGFNSFFSLFNNLPAPFILKVILAVGIVVANYICALAGMTSTSRMIYAFARDGGLPASQALATIHPIHRTPVNAIWLTAILSAAACYYSPFMFALAAGCALFLYISYAMPVAAGLFAEGNSWKEYGPFRLGAWSKPFALISIVGVIILAYAGIQPPFNPIILPLFPDLVFPLNQLTNPLIFLAVALALGWFLSERKRFQGPPIGAEAIKRRQAEIAARERALEEAAARS